MEIEGGDAIWKALANSHRRRILDLLRAGPSTTSSLVDHFDELSRFAVMQHLDVLVVAGLVVVTREGRKRFNHLNAVPFREQYERWVNHFADHDAEGLLAVRRLVEQEHLPMSVSTDAPPARTVVIENELRIKGATDVVFDVIVHRQHEWFPYSYGGDRLQSIVIEARPGGDTYEDWGDGNGWWYGTVTAYDKGRTFGMRGQLGAGIVNDSTITLEADGDDTIVRMSRTCFGPISDEMLGGIKTHGDLDLFVDKIQAVVDAA